MKPKLELSIITVNYGLNQDLKKTCDSIDTQSSKPFQHIVVVSGVSLEEQKLLKQKFSSDYRHFIFNQDNSIYNAMNIGLGFTKGTHVFFLNGGDEFIDKTSMSLLLKKIKLNKCLVFCNLLMYKNKKYLRFNQQHINRLIKQPCHQGFVAPINSSFQVFDEEKRVTADQEWMFSYIKKFGVEICSDVLVMFYLGGISNYPTVNTIKIKFKENLKSGFFEIIKYLIRKISNDDIYFHLLMKKNCCELVE